MLTPREEKFLSTYEKSLQGPKWKFVIVYGLTWAVIVLLLTTAANALFNLGSPLWQSSRSVAISLLINVVGGLTYGWLSRWLLLREYKKIKARQARAGEAGGSLQ